MVLLPGTLAHFLRTHALPVASAIVLLVLVAVVIAPNTSAAPPRYGPPQVSLTPPDSQPQPLFQTQTGTSRRSRLGGRGSGGIKGISTIDTTKGRYVPEDSTWIVYLDSTARLEQWKYKRYDSPQVRLFPDREYPLFAKPAQTQLRREVTADSLVSQFTFRKQIGGEDVKVPLTLSLKEYIAARRKHEMRMMLAEEARKGKQLQGKKDIGDVLSSFTKIFIPIPPNPILNIFGGGGVNLQISGAVDIRAGFRNTSSDQTTANRLDQTRNEPDFNQEVQVNVNGTIGDKLNILADWNTQRTFEYENQLKIKYTGYEDEIVQSVEAGNVSLQTPSAFIGSSAALFGVKAKFQTGPLTLTALASQKKGQIKEVEAKGGAQEIPFEMQPWNYSTNHFFVDTLYKKFYEPYYQAAEVNITAEMAQAQIVEEEVWISFYGNQAQQVAESRQGIAYISLPSRNATTGYDSSLRSQTPVDGRIEAARFVRLKRDQDYELAGGGYTGVISLNYAVQDNQIVAIAYRTVGGTQVGELSINIPSTDTSRTMILKMLKPKNLNAVGRTYADAWGLMLKNIYAVGGRNMKKEGFSLDVYRRTPGREDETSILNERLIRVLGVDNFDANGQPSPSGDNTFDFLIGKTVNQARGEVIFPWLEPFRSGIKTYFARKGTTLPDTSEYLFSKIYDTTKTEAQRDINNRYVIKGKATGEATSKYNLGFNVVEGSVRVLLNGVALTPNVDYTVDYIVGEVVIRNPSALVPGANLQIKYEQNDLFQLASKTLLGVRGDLFLSSTSSLGFTFMNLNQQSLSDKVRLGEEPNTNTIMGIDGATSFKLPFLTNALDALPILATREASELKLSGEAAYVIPDPNTRKSPIPSDGGAGIAYIDDFEGARRTIPLGVNYASWYQTSPPLDRLFGGNMLDTAKMNYKAKTIWFNEFNVPLTDIYPDKLAGTGANNQTTVMHLWYYPRQRGQFNYVNAAGLRDSLNTKNWGGVQRPVSISGTNLINENINFIEIWMQVLNDGRGAGSTTPGKIYVDLGSISEDVVPYPVPYPTNSPGLNTEDLVPPSTTINNTLQIAYEDVGLDMLTDAQEATKYGNLTGDGDPSGDNYSINANLNPDSYARINGTEKNGGTTNGIYPDTEDLNSNGIVDRTNSYFRYEVSLDTLASRNPQIVGGGIKGKKYYQFRIPIRDTVAKIGTPSFENVEFIRISFQNADTTIGLRIADFSLVGNQWQELKKEDTTFAVSIVGIEENSNIYSPPPGVVREKDKTRPNEDVYGNEQSLSLIMRDIPVGESRMAVKYYTYRPLDLFNYKTMKMFVHGDESTINFVNLENYNAEFFFRFGADSLNYYEYRSPIRRGWDPDNEVVVKFSDLTAIKQKRDSVTVLSAPVPVPGGPPGAAYRVLGNPSLTQVRYMAVGVTNPRVPGIRQMPLRGEVWVNELRVIEVDDTPGWAYRTDASLKLADLGNVSFNYSQVDPNFHSLELRFGSRQNATNWGISANMELAKFFPSDWAGTSLPVSYSHQVSLTKPKYLPQSDVLVGEAARLERQRLTEKGLSEEQTNAAVNDLVLSSESYRVTDTWAAPNFRIAIPSNEWWVRDTWNKLSFGFSYTRATERNPSTVRRLSWQWNAKLAYALTFNPDYYVQPFKSIFDGLWFLDSYKDFKIWFAPQNFSWSVTANRTRDVSLQRIANAQELISRNFYSQRGFQLGWKATEGGILNLSGDYNLNIDASWLDLETELVPGSPPNTPGRQRSFSKIMDDIFFSTSLINFGKDTRYSQRNNFNTRPDIPNIFNIKKYLDLSFSYGVDYSWQDALTGERSKSAGFSNNINLSLNFKMKSLFDPLFEDSPESQSSAPQGPGRGKYVAREPGDESQTPTDSTAAPDSTQSEGGGLGKTLAQLKQLAKVFIKVPFLDYETVTITFTQSNQAGNSGVVGRPGFVNFWGRVPFFQEADPKYGPSRLYQLGLISDPHGRLVNFGSRSKFPWFGWDVEPGIRAPGGVLQNTYRQTNRLSFKTSRALWEGARLDLNWNVGWSFNSTENVTTDSLGRIIREAPLLGQTDQRPVLSTSGSVDRSYLTFPNVLFLGMFKSDLKEVSKKFAQAKAVKDGVPEEEKLAKAFEEGFEALPLLRKVFGQFAPRVNWSLRWDGLEKLPMFSGFVSRLSLDHAYTSNYTRSYANRPNGGGERTENQRIAYGFAPLFGMNFTFKDLLKGSMGANVRYNTNTTYDLAPSSRNLIETLAQEISVTASYSRRGFEIPFFGLSLNNDLEINASYSLTTNSRRQYEIAKLDVNTEGTPLEGSTRTVLEPRIKYVLSQRVNASVYYRHTKIAPDAQGSTIPGSTTNEAGLDIHIAIQ